jgi:hypothetical protein
VAVATAQLKLERATSRQHIAQNIELKEFTPRQSPAREDPSRWYAKIESGLKTLVRRIARQAITKNGIRTGK